MCPCSPNDVSFPSPSGPSGPAIPGFGIPFQIPVPSIPFPAGFPEDLLYILNLLQMLIPPGALKPALNLNFGKDIFDAIMKLLDQFMPFLMLYKFFLPILNLIICIIEVLCALTNPIALIVALERLFTQCLPPFLNLFPIFALIIMIISLLLLILALIEYIIAQILKFILALLRNINALVKAFQNANANSVLAIAKKLGVLLCIFQNLFVLLAFFGIIIQVIKDILGMLFAIPPCEPSGSSACCNSNTCPAIVQNNYTNQTGIFQYLPEAAIASGITLPPPFSFNVDVRAESWQLYDPFQTLPEQFWNIVDGYDVTQSPKPVYFPTDSSYSASTAPQQAAYTVDLRLFYNPAEWGRPGSIAPQYIQFKDCIVLAPPTQYLQNWNSQGVPEPTGVLYLAGGSGFLDDGTTQLDGYMADGYTPISPPVQATLNNFLHQKAAIYPSSSPPALSPTDGETFVDMQYTFKPNLAVLMQKDLVTAGCNPQFMMSKAFVNNVMFANVATQTASLSALVNSSDFPDPTATQQCLTAAVSTLRSNLTTAGVAEFQTTATLCLSDLQNKTQNALTSAIGIGFSPCNSNFALSPSIQFTTLPIQVSVNINENNSLPLTQGVPATVAQQIASQITGYPTFGTISPFTYDGYQAFTATITSDTTGSGSLMVAYQNQILCTNTLPTDGSAPSHTLQSLDYQFVYAPATISSRAGEGDTTGPQPRRDAGDLVGGD